MRAELANKNHCAVPFLSRADVNLCRYYYTYKYYNYAVSCSVNNGASFTHNHAIYNTSGIHYTLTCTLLTITHVYTPIYNTNGIHSHTRVHYSHSRIYIICILHIAQAYTITVTKLNCLSVFYL